MRTKIYPFIFILLLIPKELISQHSDNNGSTSQNKNQIGIQFNPFINERLLSAGGLRFVQVVSSLRYGYRVTKNITTGLEFSCYFPVSIGSGHNLNHYNYFNYRIGLFTRYLYPAYSRFQIFAEASPYYSHYWGELTSYSDKTPYRDDKFGYYVAPGVTFYSKSKRISFDLYYKFSNLMFTNGKKAVISYKVNFNF